MAKACSLPVSARARTISSRTPSSAKEIAGLVSGAARSGEVIFVVRRSFRCRQPFGVNPRRVHARTTMTSKRRVYPGRWGIPLRRALPIEGGPNHVHAHFFGSDRLERFVRNAQVALPDFHDSWSTRYPVATWPGD